MGRSIALIFAGLAACGGAAGPSVGTGPGSGVDGGGHGGSSAGSDGGSSTEGGSGGGSGGGDGGATSSAVCPSTAPTFDSSCPALGLTCSYGDSPRPACRTINSCGGAQQCNCGSDNCPPSTCTTPKVWIGGGPGSGFGLTDRCAWTCPANPPSAGQVCTPPGYCAQADGTHCGCIGINSSGASVWKCLPPPSDSRCPHVAPLIGSACTDEGLACANYDLCVTGSRVLCKGGTWVDNFGSCPN